MKKNKSNRWVRPIVFMLSLVVLACGGDDDWNAPSNTTGGSTSGSFWGGFYTWGPPSFPTGPFYPSETEFLFSELDSGKLLFKYQSANTGMNALVDLKKRTSGIFNVNRYPINLRISPESDIVVFSSPVETNGKIFGIHVCPTSISDSRLITSPTWHCFNPGWSLDGSKIYFWNKITAGKNEFALFTIDKNGTGLTKLTSDKISQEFSTPSESPSGQLTFSTNQTSDSKVFDAGIYLFDLISRKKERIVTKNSESFLESPVFSPDGRKIAYLRVGRNNSQYQFVEVLIWDMNSKTSTLLSRVNAFGSQMFDFLQIEMKVNLAWSPEGSKILFTVPEGTSWNFYAISPDGNNLKKITTPSGQMINYEVSWGR